MSGMEAGKQIRAWRKQEKLTQHQAAVILGVTGNFVGLLERGERKPSLPMANTLKRLAGIPTEAWDEPAAEPAD